MAWTAEDKFNSYSAGNLDGNNGGTGWSGAWTYKEGGHYSVETSDTYEGAAAISGTNTNGNTYRDFSSSVSSGVFYVAMKFTSGSGDASFYLKNGTGASFSVFAGIQMRDSGHNIKITGASSNTILSGFDTTKWYLFEVTIISTSSFKVRYYVDGAWSSYFGPYTSGVTGTVDGIDLNSGSNQTVYWDYISPTNPFSTNVTATPSVATAAFAALAPTITAVKNITISAAVLSASFAAPAATVNLGQTITPSVLSAAYAAPAPTIATVQNVSVSPSGLTLAAATPEGGSFTSGPNGPGAVTQTDPGGISPPMWVNPNNVKVSDDTYAVITVNGAEADSYLLNSTDFGFSIPSNATIDGITVEIERHVDTGETVSDSFHSVVLLKAGVAVGTGTSSASNWPTSDQYQTYGSATDLWGTTWTPAEINNASFGFRFAASAGASGDNTGRVDHVRITIHYTTSGPTVATGATATATVLSVASSAPAPTIAAIQNLTAAPSVATASFSAPAVTVAVDTGVTATPSTASAAFSAPSPTLNYSYTTTPSAASAAFAAPAVSVSVQAGVTVQPDVLAASFSAPAPTVAYGYTTTVSIASAAFAVIDPRRVASILINIAKHDTSLSNQSRNDASPTNVAKHDATLTNVSRSH